MVCSEVHFDSFSGEGAGREVHDAGTVDEDVDLRDVGPGEELSGGFADGLLAGEVESEDVVVHIGGSSFECIDALLKF